ncbi:hypothetical protein FHR24_001059 [Wenyingzhuangia heitensis]|uniref:Uncharacterized protein n=1 Tax=Wenyingzhuangia heitensis TaxID=1487859 RepID=A0ABX0U9Y6_9FLAO|nr:hypothetical protein [Wenyingzhuangia heitensis]NIJ44620.1 hypothetical protein [Wenyingzhuangia heitensis]
MSYLNKSIETSSKKVSNTSLVNRSLSDGIFKTSDYNIFLVKESGLGVRSLSCS